ncbi:PQQ-dependent sugar dehydrogenase [Geomonas limicola]|uniref:PQQ-dependent sugar dehydrogenase n=1 Tax=Geomonas limicola TaxID=2740186 RepID=UPI001FE30B03|nr:PQQ-dependent sugar dehydrogenase [Geomonas limicola]
MPASVSLVQVASGLNRPLTITNAGDSSGRLFVVEQGGTIRFIRNGALASTPFLDISNLVNQSGGEEGLLGLAFPPGFPTRNSFYVNYTDRNGLGNTVIARFSLSSDPDRADPATRSQVLTFPQPFANHNGGQLAFGPDGLLYIGSGDGGSSGDPLGNGQNRSVLLGKILRLDVLSGTAPYAIPAGNPFGNEIWGYGLRNPWRFSFDRSTGDLYLPDVGENTVEELNFQPAGAGSGANYGWNIMEGDRCFADPSCSSAGITLPVVEYLHGSGDCAITGGYVYRGNTSALQGTYLYGDFCSGRIWGAQHTGTTWHTALLNDSTLGISTFGEDETGEVYLADYNGGSIYHVVTP